MKTNCNCVFKIIVFELNDVVLFQKGAGTSGSVSEGLKSLYKSHLKPLETSYLFHQFHSPKLSDADFSSKPSVMLIGQYSTGKVNFLILNCIIKTKCARPIIF